MKRKETEAERETRERVCREKYLAQYEEIKAACAKIQRYALRFALETNDTPWYEDLRDIADELGEIAERF